MKSFIRHLSLGCSVFFLSLFCDTNLTADVLTLAFSNTNGVASGTNFVVASNVLAEVKYVYVGSSCTLLTLTGKGNTGTYSLVNQQSLANNLPSIVGPAIIGLTNADGCACPIAFLTIQTTTLTAGSTNTLPNTIPSTAVVIPNDNGAPVNILLESSVDMVNWNSALPGTYGTSSSNRFFRVRAQR